MKRLGRDKRSSLFGSVVSDKEQSFISSKPGHPVEPDGVERHRRERRRLKPETEVNV